MRGTDPIPVLVAPSAPVAGYKPVAPPGVRFRFEDFGANECGYDSDAD